MSDAPIPPDGMGGEPRGSTPPPPPPPPAPASGLPVYGGPSPYGDPAAFAPQGVVPDRPRELRTAVVLMRVGGAIAALTLPTVFLLRSEIERAMLDAAPDMSQQDLDAAVGLGMAFAVVMGLIGAGLWFWMAWANGEGKRWARVTASVFFGFSVLGVLSNLAQPGALLSKLLGVVQFGIGLAAIILLHRPESSRYYDARSG